MSTSHETRTPGTGARVGRAVGYLVAAVINAVLLYLVNVEPGWEAVPFLTPATEDVLAWVNASLWVGVVANLVYAVWWPWWVRCVGEIVTAGVSIAAALRVWEVFPFDLGAPWSLLVRWVLVVVVVGSAISIVVQLVRLDRGPRRP